MMEPTFNFEIGSRERFEQSFIIPPIPPYVSLIDFLKENQTKAIDIGNNYRKCEFDDFVYYWIEYNSIVTLAASFAIRPYALIVCDVFKESKSPSIAKLFKKIIQERSQLPSFYNNILFTDAHLLNEGDLFWGSVWNNQITLSVFNGTQPGQTFSEIDRNVNSLPLLNHKYIMSELGERYIDTRICFNTRRSREIGGLL